uniref:CBFD_NFYB_HMF domain-containing protein n=1 Tax=Heterorhabditis bacteriophora TaxID=37862 RepID=A0A1I7XQ39_HETBA
MDNIFRSDEQEFISAPVDFRCFMEDAIVARSYTHRLANPGSLCNEDTVELSKRVANITGTPLQLMQKLVENI